MLTVYFDYQIFDNLSKDKNTLQILKLGRKNFKYICSTAHLEEVHKAVMNSNNEDNFQKALLTLKNIILFTEYGVLNPIDNNNNNIKMESKSNCLKRIIDYPTDLKSSIPAIKATYKAPHFSHEYNLLIEKERRESNKNIQKKLAENIWKECDIIKEINNTKITPDIIHSVYQDLYHDYKKNPLLMHIAFKRFLENSKQKIYPNCYKDITNSYGKKEYVIEQLYRILSNCGYAREKRPNLILSGEYDVTHMIYGTYCNYFVTLDKKLYKKCLAIYYYLGVPTKVIDIEEFSSLIPK